MNIFQQVFEQVESKSSPIKHKISQISTGSAPKMIETTVLKEVSSNIVTERARKPKQTTLKRNQISPIVDSETKELRKQLETVLSRNEELREANSALLSVLSAKEAEMSEVREKIQTINLQTQQALSEREKYWEFVLDELKARAADPNL